MDPTVLGTKLTTSLVAPLVKRLFVQDGPGAGLVDKPVRLSALVSFRGEKRTLAEKDVGKLAARMVRQAVDSPGEPPFTSDEETAVAEALGSKLLALGDLDMDDVQAVRLGHREFARELHAHSPTPDHLSRDAAFFLDSATEWACLHVVNFFTQRSTFVARTLVEQTRIQTDLIAKLDELIARTPRPDARDAPFERRYLSYVAKKHGQLTIYGIDLTNSPGKWPLDVAYLSLEAAEPKADWMPRALRASEVTDAELLRLLTQDREREPEGAAELSEGHVAELLGQTFESVSTANADEHLKRFELEVSPDFLSKSMMAAQQLARTHLAPRPADQALADNDRVLLRGVAGSGKTTLVQWLAISAARAEPEGPMSYLYGRVRIVLPLRTLTRHGERLPGPERFLEAAGCPIFGAQPEGWADRVLASARGLVLVDGIDEVPDAERERTRTWLGDLISAYPGNRWLVTSRPSAVREDWLADEGFTELALSPMSPNDVASFVRRWHAAARTGTEDEDAALETYEEQLLTAISGKADLGRLATNPLMCGLICALHRDRRGYLPHGRKELYEAALTMLLTRRDRERDIATVGGFELQQEPQTQLLQRLAYWLIRNGRTELDRERAERIIAEALPSVPAAATLGDAATVFRHLLLRSGLLREPTPGSVDFIHRTFQDYLGARAAVEVWDIGLLIDHAADDQWEDVIRMAIAHARPRERAEILTDLLIAGEEASQDTLRNRILLLAAACLEHATELDPAVRSAVEQRASTLMPPSTAQAARELAAVGPLVLDLLPDPEGLSSEEAEAVVITASHVASTAALPYLARCAAHKSLRVRSQLVWSWSRFDTERYADEVIARLDPDELYFSVTSAAQLEALRSLGGRPWLDIQGRLPGEVLAENVPRMLPTRLRISANNSLRNVHFLREASALTHLVITDCHGLRDLSGLRGLPLRQLHLNGLTSLVNSGPLTHLHKLAELTLGIPVWSTDDLPAQAPLTVLDLSRASSPHSHLRLSRWPGLTAVFLGLFTSPFSEPEWRDLAALSELVDLRLAASSLASCPESLTLTQVTDLSLVDDNGAPLDLDRIAGLFPRLTTLRVVGDEASREQLDLSPLAALQDLQMVTFPAGETPVEGLDQISHRALIIETRPFQD